jgi:CRISPR-associated protein Cas5d
VKSFQERMHVLDVRGDFACFSRPEMSVERYSYPCPTPSAARGIFEAIYFKPEFRWQTTKIEIISPPAYIALRRNEVKDKVNTAIVERWAVGKGEPEPLLADADKSLVGTDMKGRTQRQTMALKNPRFRLHAHIVPRPGKEREQKSYDEQFVRRASQGKCAYQPSFGCREFVAFFRLVTELENEPPPSDYSQQLGFMLYDVFDLRQNNHALCELDSPEKAGWKRMERFVSVFQAEVKKGVLEIPSFESELVLKPRRGERMVN